MPGPTKVTSPRASDGSKRSKESSSRPPRDEALVKELSTKLEKEAHLFKMAFDGRITRALYDLLKPNAKKALLLFPFEIDELVTEKLINTLNKLTNNGVTAFASSNNIPELFKAEELTINQINALTEKQTQKLAIDKVRLL